MRHQQSAFNKKKLFFADANISDKDEILFGSEGANNGSQSIIYHV